MMEQLEILDRLIAETEQYLERLYEQRREIVNRNDLNKVRDEQLNVK